MKNALASAVRRMSQALEQRISVYERDLLRLNGRLQNSHPEKRLLLLQRRLERSADALRLTMEKRAAGYAAEVTDLTQRLERAADRRLDRESDHFEKLRIRLMTLNPRAVLERGYALVTDGEVLITSAQTAGSKAELHINFSDGTLKVVPDVKG